MKFEINVPYLLVVVSCQVSCVDLKPLQQVSRVEITGGEGRKRLFRAAFFVAIWQAGDGGGSGWGPVNEGVSANIVFLVKINTAGTVIRFCWQRRTCQLKSNFLLCDIWRKKNPRITQFTWLNSQATISCRLDKFFVSNELAKSTCNCDIKNCHLVAVSRSEMILRAFGSLELKAFNSK